MCPGGELLVVRPYPPAGAGDWRATILALWREARCREQRHAAVELAVHWPFLRWLNMESVPILDELIVNGAWWDYVDRIAPAGLGHVLSAEPKPMGAMMRGWAGDKNIWRRRAALLCQLGFKEDTDLALLYDCVGDCMGHREFFVQKAMGSSRLCADRSGRGPAMGVVSFTAMQGPITGEVWRYVVAYRSCLSRLTRREALKNLA